MRQGLGVRIAVRWAFRQALQAVALHLPRDTSLERPGWGWLLTQNPMAQALRCVALEWQTAHQQLVEDHAEAVDIRARVDAGWIAVKLFRRHVGQRPEASAAPLPQFLLRQGDTEVGDENLVVAVHQDV